MSQTGSRIPNGHVVLSELLSPEIRPVLGWEDVKRDILHRIAHVSTTF